MGEKSTPVGRTYPIGVRNYQEWGKQFKTSDSPPPWMGAKLDFIFVKNILVPLCCPLGPISGKGQKTRHDLSKRLTSIHFGPLLGPALRGVVRGPPKGPG